MSFCYSSYINNMRRMVLVVMVIMFAILVASPQFGAASRDGLLFQMLPRGPPKGSGPSDDHHHK
ncbi:putative transmembrane protein [Sesbania bispinosa]|nr:putative transmembrane protein [Sesbania bispinosa]